MLRSASRTLSGPDNIGRPCHKIALRRWWRGGEGQHPHVDGLVVWGFVVPASVIAPRLVVVSRFILPITLPPPPVIPISIIRPSRRSIPALVPPLVAPPVIAPIVPPIVPSRIVAVVPPVIPPLVPPPLLVPPLVASVVAVASGLVKLLSSLCESMVRPEERHSRGWRTLSCPFAEDASG